METRMLITYAGKSGSTAGVAQAVAEALKANGTGVDVKPVKEITGLDGYRAVIAGSAVRFGAWLPEMVAFVKQHQAKLSQLPVAIFTVHILNLDDNEESRRQRQAYTAPVRALIEPLDEAFFAGKVDLSQLSLSARLMARAAHAPVGDLRDWTAIRAWAERLAI
jgi:menaquinone-dependent protoporphyrinogen oxidase